MVDLAMVEANFAVWNESIYSRTFFGGRHVCVRQFYNNKDTMDCLTISESWDHLLADVWYPRAVGGAGEAHERNENVRCGGDKSVYFLYTSFLVALRKKAIISLIPVPVQANLWLMVNNNKTLLLVVLGRVWMPLTAELLRSFVWFWARRKVRRSNYRILKELSGANQN